MAMKPESRTLLLLLSGAAWGLCAAPILTYALPEGGVVTAGQASIASGGNITVIQQGSDRAVIDWSRYNIHEGEVVHYAQPSVTAATLNRIHDANPSRIQGALTANGQVYLVNPNGMVFGEQARVDVGALVASTADIGTQPFMAGGALSFNTPGKPDSAIINQGSISAKDAGLVAMVAPQVHNHGVITAKAGTVALAAGDTMTLDFYGDELLSVAVTDKVKQQSVSNQGVIRAAGGTVMLTTADAASVMDSAINMNGVVDAASASEEGGDIIFTGEGVDIHLGASARIDASGAKGGGMVRIGGEYLGKVATPTANTTTIDKGAVIHADATQQGKGGEVIVWSDMVTRYAGFISAAGGVAGGDGGFVETSGKHVLQSTGRVVASAPYGKAGEWLLDPANVTISNVDASITGNPNFIPSANAATIDTNTIKTALDGGTNVTVTTGGDAFAGTGDITVSNAITTTGTGSLTLSAYRNVTVNNTITLAGGNLLLRADNANNNAGYVSIAAAIATNGGNITIGGGSGAIAAGSGYATGGNGLGIGVRVNAANVNAGGGNIIINGRGEPGAAAGSNHGISVLGGAKVQTGGGGTIHVNGIAGGDGVSTTNHGVNVSGAGSQITTSGTGLLSVTGQGGSPMGTGGSNNGVNVAIANGIAASNTGNVTVQGTGGNNGTAGVGGGSGNNNYGVLLSGTGSITAAGGTLSVTGTGGASTGNGNHGVYLNGASTAISNSGAGSISITGTGGGEGTSSSNRGITTAGAGGFISTSGSGNISLSGTAKNSTGGVRADVANAIQTLNTGSIDIATDSLVLGAANAVNSIRALSVVPKTNGSGLGLGTGTGTLVLSDTVLGRLSWGAGFTLTLGDANTGAVDINTAYGFTNPVLIRNGSGQDITLNAVLNSSYNTGTSLTLASGDDFINNAGATPFSLAGTARWLIYSEKPADNTLSGLASGFKRYNCVYGGACPAGLAAGNGLLYSIAPTVTVTADNAIRAEGYVNPVFTASYSGFIDGDVLAAVLTGAPVITTAATLASAAGAYAITPAVGTLATTLGYGMAFVDGMLTITGAGGSGAGAVGGGGAGGVIPGVSQPPAGGLPVVPDDLPTTNPPVPTVSGAAAILMPTRSPLSLLPSTYVHPASMPDGNMLGMEGNYDTGAPTPGLDAETDNVDVLHSNARRSGYNDSKENPYAIYSLTPEMQALLDTK